MCIIEHKTYIDSDGERIVETSKPCHRATSTQLCNRVQHKNIGPIRIVEAVPKPREERKSSDSATGADGFNFGGRVARDISAGSSNRSSARGSTIMSERSVPSSASSPTLVEVKPKAPTPPSAGSTSPVSERIRAPYPPPTSPPMPPTSPPDPRRPVPAGGTTVYDYPPPFDLSPTMGNEPSRRREPANKKSDSSMKAQYDDSNYTGDASRHRRKPKVSVDTDVGPSTSSSSKAKDPPRKEDVSRPGILRNSSVKDSSRHEPKESSRYESKESSRHEAKESCRRDSKQPDRQRTAIDDTTLRPSISTSATNRDSQRKSEVSQPSISRKYSTKDSSRRDSKQPVRQTAINYERWQDADADRQHLRKESNHTLFERDQLAESVRRQSLREELARENERYDDVGEAKEAFKGPRVKRNATKERPSEADRDLRRREEEDFQAAIEQSRLAESDRRQFVREEREREAERERRRQEEDEEEELRAALEESRLDDAERRQQLREERDRKIRKAAEALEGLRVSSDDDSDDVDNAQIHADLAQMAHEREAAARRRDSVSSNRTSFYSARSPPPSRRHDSEARASDRRSDGRNSPTSTRTRRTNTDATDSSSPVLTRGPLSNPVTLHQPSVFRERGEDVIAQAQARGSRADRYAEEYGRGGERYIGEGPESSRRRRRDDRRHR